LRTFSTIYQKPKNLPLKERGRGVGEAGEQRGRGDKENNS